MVISTSKTFTKEELVRKFRDLYAENSPYIIQCVPGKVIIRCGPSEIDGTCVRMRTVDSGSESLFVSGTLKTVRERYPDLKARKKH